ncbi:MAG: toxic anion resistance protein [Anaerovoracaceae bacterium]
MNEELKNETLADFMTPPSAQAVPVLTLEPVTNQPPAAVQEAPARPVDTPAGNTTAEMQFSPEEQKIIEEFAAKIDLTNSNQILYYGSDSQQKIAAFSETALEKVRTKDLGQVGDMITDLVVELQNFDTAEESKGFLGLFKKAGNKVEAMKAKYAKAEVNVDKIVDVLEDHKFTLSKDIAMLDNMYALNIENFRQLSMYIAAGKQKLAYAQNTELPALQEKARQSGLHEDAQAANDFAEFCNRFEKKLYDLELTREVSLQMAPQIRLIQNNDTMMVEKIQTTIVNTIPLWKNQMVLALGLAHSEEAMKANRAVTDVTNDLLKKNAETLKMSTIAIAKESERGIIDIETLQQTNNALIETLDSVRKIQEEGSQKRHEAEAELTRIENELKSKLLEFKG